MTSSRPPRYGIVASRFNREITQRLVQGATQALIQKKLPKSRLDLLWVPGAFELPVAALKLAKTGRYAAVMAVGCILEGETPHHRYLSQATLTGLITAGVTSGVPVTCGVITASSWKLAMERARLRGTNRGREAALAAWDLVQTLKKKG